MTRRTLKLPLPSAPIDATPSDLRALWRFALDHGFSKLPPYTSVTGKVQRKAPYEILRPLFEAIDNLPLAPAWNADGSPSTWSRSDRQARLLLIPWQIGDEVWGTVVAEDGTARHVRLKGEPHRRNAPRNRIGRTVWGLRYHLEQFRSAVRRVADEHQQRQLAHAFIDRCRNVLTVVDEHLAVLCYDRSQWPPPRLAVVPMELTFTDFQRGSFPPMKLASTIVGTVHHCRLSSTKEWAWRIPRDERFPASTSVNEAVNRSALIAFLAAVDPATAPLHVVPPELRPATDVQTLEDDDVPFGDAPGRQTLQLLKGLNRRRTRG